MTIVGMGAMGSALARALLQARKRVTVWNRSAHRMQPLVSLGAAGTATIGEALQASPLILVCIDNYDATMALLGPDEVAQHLAGRTLIQLSTGTPREARAGEEWARTIGARYIDGAILCGPVAIGTDRGTILVAGTGTAYATCASALAPLSGDIRYLGDNIAGPAALDLAWLSERFGAFAGAAHGARLCAAEDVPVGLYASLFADGAPARWFTETIANEAYANPGATLQVWAAGLERIRNQAGDTGIDAAFPDFVLAILKRAIAAGYGDEHIAAMSKVLR